MSQVVVTTLEVSTLGPHPTRGVFALVLVCNYSVLLVIICYIGAVYSWVSLIVVGSCICLLYICIVIGFIRDIVMRGVRGDMP